VPDGGWNTWVTGVCRPIHKFTGTGKPSDVGKPKTKPSTHEQSIIRRSGCSQGIKRRGHHPAGTDRFCWAFMFQLAPRNKAPLCRSYSL
jgi:hypothetical protein